MKKPRKNDGAVNPYSLLEYKAALLPFALAPVLGEGWGGCSCFGGYGGKHFQSS